MPKAPRILNLLERELRKILTDANLKLGEFNPATGIYHIVAGTGLQIINEEDSGHTSGLLPRKIASTHTYWFSINFSINRLTSKVKALSINIYSDVNYTKLFRAEWSNNESSSAHAQPHWHVHVTEIDNKAVEWIAEESMDFEDEDEQYEKAIPVNLKNIHFAMSATWHKKVGHVEVLADSDDTEIVNWVTGALEYIFHQLTYLHNKKKVIN